MDAKDLHFALFPPHISGNIFRDQYARVSSKENFMVRYILKLKKKATYVGYISVIISKISRLIYEIRIKNN